jgi:hypothetical protein
LIKIKRCNTMPKYIRLVKALTNVSAAVGAEDRGDT